MPKTSLEAELKKARECIGMTVEELAKRIGLTPEELENIEKGKRAMSLEMYFKIISELGI